MSTDSQPPGCRLLSLVQYCQRVASAHVDSISSLGNDLRFELIKPVLAGCSPETLSRLEKTSPHIANSTAELWKDMCFKCYPLAADRYHAGDFEEPESWRHQFVVLRQAEAKRFEELGSRLRNQRVEAEERKKEREVKLTDRVPPSKRSRTGWGTSPQPKSLFQKTRSEASKIQKTMYTARMVPPMPQVKDYRILSSAPSVKLLPPPPPSSGSPCVTVKTVAYRRPYSVSSSVTSESSRSPTRSPPAPRPQIVKDRIPSRTAPQLSPTHLEPQPHNLPVGKRDPMSTLFMPKHRAHSQRPIQTQR